MLPRRMFFGLPAGIAAVLAVSACDDVKVVSAEATTLQVSPDSITLEIDQTGTLQAVIRDANGSILGGQDIVWVSSRPSIASVTGGGEVQGLAPGSSTVAARAGDVSGSAVVMVQALPGFALDRTSATFSAIAGNSDETETVQISGTGPTPATGLSLNTSYAQEGPQWLAAALSSTSTPASLNMNPNTVGLTPGEYQATVTVGANRVPSQNVQISLTVLPPPSIALSIVDVSLSTTAGSSTTDSQVVLVTNSGAASITGLFAIVFYGSQQPGNWLTATLSSGTAPAQLTLSASAASLPQGTYTATVQVQSPDAVNSPQDITVTFVVNP